MNSKPRPSRNKELLRYAGLGTQMFVSIGLALFIGLKADEWLQLSMPLLVWLLPFFALVAIMYKLIKETSKRKNSNADRKP